MKQKNQKASALVFALIILSMLLATAISIAAITTIERRSSGATDKSVQTFQVADSGAELVLNKIYGGGVSTIANIATALGGSTTCSSGVVSGSISSGKAYTVNFYDQNITQLTDCNALVSSIASIKSTGNYVSTTRAVNVAVAAGGLSYTVYCFSTAYGSVFGTPQCPATVNIGDQGPCDAGYKVQKDLGSWGLCYFGSAAGYGYYLLPPNTACGSSYSSNSIPNFYHAYLCAS